MMRQSLDLYLVFRVKSPIVNITGIQLSRYIFCRQMIKCLFPDIKIILQPLRFTQISPDLVFAFTVGILVFIELDLDFFYRFFIRLNLTLHV